ncbi:uncharacterized protein COLE_04179 [Cutaneotrichosporon oleaginosum]|nr:hypothetical protein COLE_04179 [Cutaneotrichosporon oleaginosum]
MADDPWSWEQTKPLDRMAFKDWWFHGYMNDPPADGEFMELPAGGEFHGEIACGKALTSYRKETPNSKPLQDMACDKAGDDGKMGAVHATDVFPGPAYGKSKSVKGSALGIAYNSDPRKVKPEDFVVISVNHNAPWTRKVSYSIPAGLPACPAGGCHCMWGWIPDPMNVQQMYTLVYRCNVTGQTGTEYPARPQIPRKCPFDKNNCTIGAKQMLYQFQLEGNNIHQERPDNAFYNYEYGFRDGAQTDIWITDDGKTWNTNTSDLAPIPWQTLTSVRWSKSMNSTWVVTPDSRGTPSGKAGSAEEGSPKPEVAPTPTPAPSAPSAASSAASSPASPGGNARPSASAPSASAPRPSSNEFSADDSSAKPPSADASSAKPPSADDPSAKPSSAAAPSSDPSSADRGSNPSSAAGPIPSGSAAADASSNAPSAAGASGSTAGSKTSAARSHRTGRCRAKRRLH